MFAAFESSLGGIMHICSVYLSRVPPFWFVNVMVVSEIVCTRAFTAID
jgi:hypothetical protein